MKCEVLHYDTRRASRWVPSELISRHGNQFLCKVDGIVGNGSYHATEIRFPITDECKQRTRDRLAALWHYCCDYHEGQGSWQYAVMSVCPYQGGYNPESYVNDVIRKPEARRYHELLMRKFES